MKEIIIKLFRFFGLSIGRYDEKRYQERREFYRFRDIHQKYRDFSMVPILMYADNLHLASQVQNIEGDIVECGVWRGGMIAGVAEILGNSRKYWLFDSFQGLPPSGKRDGEEARKWQADTENENYFDNCKAEEKFASVAMQMAGDPPHNLVRGWFDRTVPQAEVQRIALLRLDGDWYESTMICLQGLYPKVTEGGLIIIDDYYFWQGCTKAVHDYLSVNNITDRIEQSPHGVAYIVKNKKFNPYT